MAWHCSDTERDSALGLIYATGQRHGTRAERPRSESLAGARSHRGTAGSESRHLSWFVAHRRPARRQFMRQVEREPPSVTPRANRRQTLRDLLRDDRLERLPARPQVLEERSVRLRSAYWTQLSTRLGEENLANVQFVV